MTAAPPTPTQTPMIVVLGLCDMPLDVLSWEGAGRPVAVIVEVLLDTMVEENVLPSVVTRITSVVTWTLSVTEGASVAAGLVAWVVVRCVGEVVDGVEEGDEVVVGAIELDVVVADVVAGAAEEVDESLVWTADDWEACVVALVGGALV